MQSTRSASVRLLSHAAICAIAIGGVTSTTADAQNLLVNGGFEADGTCPTAFCTVTALTGWTVGGNVDRLSTLWTPPFEGTTSLDLSGTVRGAVWQSVSGLTVGQIYRLDFAMARNVAVPVARMDIIWTSELITGTNWTTLGATSTQTYSEPSTFTNPLWSLRSVQFAATAESMRLMFRSENPGNGGALLDATSLGAVPVNVVPEPATIPLLMAGLAGMLCIVLRQRCRPAE